MTRIAIVGDGPAGLSAALFLAKNGHEVVVFAQDETLMHFAELHNYLGVASVTGTDFQRIARDQVTAAGARIRTSEVTAAEATADGVTVGTADGDQETADYLVIAGGKASQALADAVGADRRDGAVVVDNDSRTTVDRVYAAGHLIRPERSQAIISAGAGASAALDILARESGRDVHDWDTPPEA
ncbi:MAG: FAD-dependent oxidoreductase [Euzebyales bacterium]|nr:FAD-dependent oxidoreductase [Euzebyales bacterium]